VQAGGVRESTQQLYNVLLNNDLHFYGHESLNRMWMNIEVHIDKDCTEKRHEGDSAAPPLRRA
jgi:hypothetical protein